MEDALLGMAEAPQHVVCTGWRPAFISDWRDALDAHAIFGADRGGHVSPDAYFQAKARARRVERGELPCALPSTPFASERCV